jgi:ribonuclease P protein component
VIVHVVNHGTADPSRCGVIVSRAVGNAVTRNRVRRRLRAIGREVLGDLGSGCDIVMRALPGSPEVDWATLHAEVTDSIRRGVQAQ